MMNTKKLGLIVILLLISLAGLGTLRGLAAPPITVTPTPGHRAAVESHNIEFVGQLGGAVHAAVVDNDRLYLGQGGRMLILDLTTPLSPTIMGQTMPFDGVVQNLAVSGNYAYLALGNAGFRVINITDPANPVEVGALAEYTYLVTVEGNYAYTVASSGVRVIDISNPTAPALKGTYGPGGGPISGIAATGEYIYVAAGVYGGLDVVRVSNPSFPVQVGSFSGMSGSPSDVEIVGNYAFVTSLAFGSSGSVSVFDITNPKDPFFVQAYPFSSFSQSTISGNQLYVFSNHDQVLALDITDPTDLVRLGTYTIDSAGASAMAINDNLAYIAQGNRGLQILDVSSAIKQTGFHYPPGQVNHVTAVGNYAYLGISRNGDDDSLRVVDVSNTQAPTEKSFFRPPDDPYIIDLAADGNFVYLLNTVSGGYGSFRIVDVSNPANPAEVGLLSDAWGRYDYPKDVTVAGDYAYTVGNQHFQVIDVSDPVSPTMVGAYALSGADIAVVGRYAYVAMRYDEALKVIDVLTPTAPVEVGAYVPTNPKRESDNIVVSGNRAYFSAAEWITILDLTDPVQPTYLGSYAAPDKVTGLQVLNNALYVGLGDEGLLVLDVSNPAEPLAVMTLQYWPVKDLCIIGSKLYVAAEWQGLRVLDIANVSMPVRRGKFNTVNALKDVAVAGDYLYVSGEQPAINVVQVSDPTAPALIDTVSTSDDVMAVNVAKDYAYVAANNAGLQIFDIHNPRHITMTGDYDVTGYARDVAISGTLAYVPDIGAGLSIVDVANPVTPSLVSEYRVTTNYPANLDVDASMAYLPIGWGLEIVDVSQPQTPTFVHFYTGTYASKVVVEHPIAYVAARDKGVQFADISNPTNPTLLSGYAHRGEPEDVAAVINNYAYVIEGNYGLRILNVANATYPVEVGAYNEKSVWEAVITAGYAYLLAEGDLVVLDVTNPTQAQAIGALETPGTAYDIAVWGQHLFIADGDDGLRVVNVNTPANPVEVGYVDLPSNHRAYGVVVAESGGKVYAYVAHNYSGMYIFDVTNPANPAQVGYYSLDYYNDMTLSGNYLYVAQGSRGLEVLDVSFPPVPVSTDRLYSWVTDVSVVGSYLYAVDAHGYLRIIDIANPADINTVSTYSTANLRGALGVGNSVYLADAEDGLEIINVSNPTNPLLRGVYRSPNNVLDVAVSGDYVYAVDESGNLRVINASNPAYPIEKGLYTLPSTAYDLAVVGENIYVAGGDGGLFVLRTNLNVTYANAVYLPLIQK